MQGSDKVHGAALGDAEIAATRAAIGWDSPPFEIPADVYAAWDSKQQGAALQATWTEKFNAYRDQFPKEAAELIRRMQGELPATFDQSVAALIDACVQ